MTKAEMIERYGLEWYEEQKRKAIESHRTKEYTEYCRKFHKERYKDPENRRHRLRQNILWEQSQFVKDKKLELIENYECAKADNFKGWVIHHRIELHPDYSLRYSREKLIELEIYYNRPPSELIWMKRNEHARIHMISMQMEKRGIE